MNQLSVTELATWLADTTRKAPLLLDVREPWEVQTASMPGITHVPMNQIPARLDEVKQLAGERDIVAICHHGGRSMQVAMFLEHMAWGRCTTCPAASMPGRSRSIRPFRGIDS